MKLITASEAQNSFGRVITDSQREPVFVKKNNQIIGAFVSIEDLKNTYIADFLSTPSQEYEEWVEEKVTTTYNRVKTHGVKAISETEIDNVVMGKVESLLNGKK